MSQVLGKEYLDTETVEGLIDLVDGDGEMIIELIDTLLETTPELIESLREAVQTNKAREIREASHALKSSTANMGALVFSGLCNTMELMAKNGELSEAPITLERILLEYNMVETSMNQWKAEVLSMG